MLQGFYVFWREAITSQMAWLERLSSEVEAFCGRERSGSPQPKS
jgi:hypothetical protein